MKIFGFLVLNEGQSAHLENEQGEPLYAVAVCYESKGKIPKSKPHDICNAMPRPDEYDPKDIEIAFDLALVSATVMPVHVAGVLTILEPDLRRAVTPPGPPCAGHR